MGKVRTLIYGVVCYILFFLTFLYTIGFVGDIVVPKTIDSGSTASGGLAWLGNILLLALFAIQHSVMARPGFKKAWTKIVPKPAERSTFVLFTVIVLALLFWLWQPMPSAIWNVGNPAGRIILWALFWIGFLIVLLATFMIGHFELFGVVQVARHLAGTPEPPPKFKSPGFYKIVRHPIMLGFIVAFWAIPTMTSGHLLFAIVTTAYILVAIQLEERDLLSFLGEEYTNYRKKVRSLIPIPKKQ